MDLPRLGLGGGPLGNYLTAISDAQAHAVVDAAWEAGIRYFDTAPFYGHGLSERRLGAALRDRPRDAYVLSTKVGRLVRPGPGAPGDPAIFQIPSTNHCEWDFSRDGVLRCLDESLTRLGLDSIDIALVHDPDRHWPQALDEAFATLADLRAQGVVRAIGIGMNQAEMLVRFAREADPDLVIAANTYTLVRRSALAELLPLCQERGIAVVAAGVLHRGLLAASPPADAPADIRRIAETCTRHGVPIAAAAIQFPLRHPAVRSVLIGAHSPEQIQANVHAYGYTIPNHLWPALSR